MGSIGRASPSAAIALGLAVLALAGCSTWNWGGQPQQPQTAEPAPLPAPVIPARVRSAEIVGRWGYAAFHRAQDRSRTEAAARRQCRQPYVIGAGPGGGVMMHLADSNEPQELALKGSQSGRDYIGPASDPPGGPRDREIVAFDGRILVLSFVDPEVAKRYGTSVYVRCAPRA
jgi:hypothetical protein